MVCAISTDNDKNIEDINSPDVFIYMSSVVMNLPFVLDCDKIYKLSRSS